jgi:hypothetical protein
MLGNYNLSNGALNLYKKPSNYKTSYKSPSDSSSDSSSSDLDNEKQEINSQILSKRSEFISNLTKQILRNIII